MSVRPPQIRYLTAGKALGAAVHKGFAATWNWLLAWVNFFKAGKGLKLSNMASGHPRIDVLIEGADGIDVTCAGDGQAYVIGFAGQGSEGDGGGGDEEPDEPFDPDQPWDPSDPWNPEEPWNPDDPDAPYDGPDNPDSPDNPDGGGGSRNDCNGWSDDDPGNDDDPGMGNDGDSCGVLNGW